MNYIKQIEALIFASDQPITTQEIIKCLEQIHKTGVSKAEVNNAIEGIAEKYRSGDFVFELANIAEGYQFLTRTEYFDVVGELLKQRSSKKLSAAALETLAIIAYKQPATKVDIEQVRGVNCDYSVNKLLEKDLIEMSGKSEGPGRPILYSTSQFFLDYFGINSVIDLPKLKDIEPLAEENGEDSLPPPVDLSPETSDEPSDTNVDADENPVAEEEISDEE
ncbi:MAG: SMC-Scp complex subunit ScpB [Bacteroidetes bacterium]|nr:SMC-Scp complex subunit ScpB [Bacteroidota bacterium]